jgi:hypothetical protein
MLSAWGNTKGTVQYMKIFFSYSVTLNYLPALSSFLLALTDSYSQVYLGFYHIGLNFQEVSLLIFIWFVYLFILAHLEFAINLGRH